MKITEKELKDSWVESNWSEACVRDDVYALRPTDMELEVCYRDKDYLTGPTMARGANVCTLAGFGVKFYRKKPELVIERGRVLHRWPPHDSPYQGRCAAHLSCRVPGWISYANRYLALPG